MIHFTIATMEHWWPLMMSVAILNYIADCFLTGKRVKRALAALLPRWMAPLTTLCVIIPGPFDEGVMVVVAVIVILMQPIRLRKARSAWRGGKSHRAQKEKEKVLV